MSCVKSKTKEKRGNKRVSGIFSFDVGSRISGLGYYCKCGASRVTVATQQLLIQLCLLLHHLLIRNQLVARQPDGHTFPRGSVFIPLMTLCIGLGLVITTAGQADMEVSPPRRNLLMALEVQRDIWNCSPAEGGSEGEHAVRGGQG